MRAADRVEKLAMVPLFSSCTKRELKLLDRLSETKRFKRGETIIYEGEESTDMYVILRGEASVRRRGRLITALQPGDSFGELAALDPAPRNATVRALEDLIVLRLTRDHLLRALEQSPRLGIRLLQQMARRLRDTNRRVYG